MPLAGLEKINLIGQITLKNYWLYLHEFRFVLLLLPVLATGVFISQQFSYLTFVLLVAHYFLKARRGTREGLLAVLLYSIVLPNNVIPWVLLLIGFTLVFLDSLLKRRITHVLLPVLFIGMICVLGVLHAVPLLNLTAFFLISTPFFLASYVFNEGWTTYEFKRVITEVLLVQVLANIFILLRDFPLLFSYKGIPDSFVGTMEHGGAHFLAVFFILFLIYYFRPWKHLLFFGLVLIFLLLYSAVHVYMALFLATSIWLLGIGRFHWRKLLLLGGVALSFYHAFLLFSPPWMAGLLQSALSPEYLSRQNKIATYFNTYITLPSQDLKYLLFGNGPGYYSSRAALTVADLYGGLYQAVFARFFDRPLMSEYTEKFIFPTFNPEYLVLGVNDGTINFPYSSWISLMGEFGLIGLLLFIAYLVNKIMKRQPMDSITILSLIFLLSLALFDNWLENTKVMIIFWAFYYYGKQPTHPLPSLAKEVN